MGDQQIDTVPAPPPALGSATMCEALLTTAAQRPDSVALRTPDDSVALTYAELTRRIAATASLLHDLGLGRGDALAIMLLNRPEFHVVDAAAMLLGRRRSASTTRHRPSRSPSSWAMPATG